MIPFAVVGSEKDIEVDGKVVIGRRNRYGVVNVEDKSHCEFVDLRGKSAPFYNEWESICLTIPRSLPDFLTRSHLQDLIETTSATHYESFRRYV